MRIFKSLLLALPFLCFSCSNDRLLNENSIRITKINEHPFLIDHCRRLITVDKNGNKLDDEFLYCDSGNGCNAFLYDTEKTFTLIDCNGHWYSITKRTGQISKLGWYWLKNLPKNYKGTYSNIGSKSTYSFKHDSLPTIYEVYKYKDPNE